MLELKNISYRVADEGKDLDIIDDISLNLKDDMFYVITGPNGGGKSTLAKLIAGIIRPTSGTIHFDGRDITDMSITERARLGIGYAFQQPVRFKGITVKDLITLAAGENASATMACEYLSEVGLCAADYMNREVNSSLSGGELKRIEIAVTLARKTPFTVFDEPEAGIDLWSFNNLIKVFEKLHDEVRGSIVIISHQERILNIADELIVVADGKVTKQGAKDDILPDIFKTDMSCRFTR